MGRVLGNVRAFYFRAYSVPFRFMLWCTCMPDVATVPIYRPDGSLWFELGRSAENGEWEMVRLGGPITPAALHAAADKADTMAQCYFIGSDGGPVKIGYSVDVAGRFKSIQSCSPVPLRLLATVGGGEAREAAYHIQFASARLHGEWFSRTPEIEAEIGRLARA